MTEGQNLSALNTGNILTGDFQEETNYKKSIRIIHAHLQSHLENVKINTPPPFLFTCIYTSTKDSGRHYLICISIFMDRFTFRANETKFYALKFEIEIVHCQSANFDLQDFKRQKIYFSYDI